MRVDTILEIPISHATPHSRSINNIGLLTNWHSVNKLIPSVINSSDAFIALIYPPRQSAPVLGGRSHSAKKFSAFLCVFQGHPFPGAQKTQ
jgi:hypothetical protein